MRSKIANEFEQLIRFTTVGLFVTFLYFLISVLLRDLGGLSIHISTGIALISTYVASYFGHKIISFKAEGLHSFYIKRFFIGVIIVSVIHFVVMDITTRYYPEYFRFSVLCIMIVIPIISFLLNRFLVFNKL